MHRLVVHGDSDVPRLGVEIVKRSINEANRTRRCECFGAQEYWIVDPRDESFTIYRLSDKCFQATRVTDTITSPLLPRFSLPVTDVFAE